MTEEQIARAFEGEVLVAMGLPHPSVKTKPTLKQLEADLEMAMVLANRDKALDVFEELSQRTAKAVVIWNKIHMRVQPKWSTGNQVRKEYFPVLDQNNETR